MDTPIIFPSRISHRRFSPKQHGFSYSYFLVCVPVGWSGTINGFLSVDVGDCGRRSWLHVDARDHLSRSNSSRTLRGKLDEYLRTQGVRPLDFPHALLVCQPTVLGYQFNPASFWHLYSADLKLKAMIVEVNNTFDERRMYFLRPEDKEEADAMSEKKESRLRMSWSKDFHVSPFNSRLGSYSITSLDPLDGSAEVGAQVVPQRIETTITLSTSEGHPKLVARAWSVGPGLDPSRMTWMQKAALVLRWWWVGLATFPRIVFEAARLFFQHKLHVWYRPEVLPTSTGRMPTRVEIKLEQLFADTIQCLAAQSQKSLRIGYCPPEAFGRAPMEFCRHGETTDQHETAITINITTPAFYSRVIHYGSLAEALQQEILQSEFRNRTGWCSDEEALATILSRPSPFRGDSQKRMPLYIRTMLRLASLLRIAPAEMSYPWPAILSPTAPSPARPEPLKAAQVHKSWLAFDEYSAMAGNPRQSQQLLACEIGIFLAERLALGSLTLLVIETVVTTGAAWYILKLGMEVTC